MWRVWSMGKERERSLGRLGFSLVPKTSKHKGTKVKAAEVHAFVKATLRSHGDRKGRDIIMRRVCREDDFAAAAICHGLKIAETIEALKKEALAAAKAAQVKTLPKEKALVHKTTNPTKKKKGQPTMKRTSLLTLVTLVLALFLAVSAPAFAKGKPQAQDESAFIAMPMTGKAAQQITSQMKQEAHAFDATVAETQAQENEARMLFVVWTSRVMANYRYSFDKTMSFLSANENDEDLIAFLRKTGLAGTFGTAFQVLQRPGWGEKAVDMKVISNGTLAAIRATSIGKD